MDPLKIYRAPLPISVKALKAEVSKVSKIFPFELGPFASSIPLAGKNCIASSHREHYNNFPAANIIGNNNFEFPALNRIFNIFDAPKTAFRLIRRPPQATYELHVDTDRGKGVWRFQVPIVSGPKAVICLSDKKSIKEVRSEEDAYTPEKFRERFKNHRISTLEEGWLYGFNVDHIHTLHNGDLNARITLIIDVLMNSTSKGWWQKNSLEVLI